MKLLSQQFEDFRVAASIFSSRQMRAFKEEILSDIPCAIALFGLVIGLYGIYLENWVEKPAMGEMYYTLRSLHYHGHGFFDTLFNMAFPFIGDDLQYLSLLIILVKPIAIVYNGIRNYSTCDRLVFFWTIAGLVPVFLVITL